MKAKHASDAATLVDALRELPQIARALTNKPNHFGYTIALEIQASEMNDGESQGSSHYCYVPLKTGRAIVRAAERIIIAELRKMGVKP